MAVVPVCHPPPLPLPLYHLLLLLLRGLLLLLRGLQLSEVQPTAIKVSQPAREMNHPFFQEKKRRLKSLCSLHQGPASILHFLPTGSGGRAVCPIKHFFCQKKLGHPAIVWGRGRGLGLISILIKYSELNFQGRIF